MIKLIFLDCSLNYEEQISKYQYANMQTECKFVVDFQCFHVNNFQNDEYLGKLENFNNSNCLW